MFLLPNIFFAFVLSLGLANMSLCLCLGPTVMVKRSL
jgi:hypothetical protein